MPINKSTYDTRINEISNLIANSKSAISIGFSGGKDSSAVVKILWNCAKKLGSICPPLKVIYCDTEVENPIIDKHVKSTLSRLEQEAHKHQIDLTCEVLRPQLHQGFFVRIIGRGYPTPTNSFRWCTKDIRIRPFQWYLKGQNVSSIVAIGTRFGESAQRDRSLKRHADESSASKFLQRQREGSKDTILLTPIIDFDTSDVWELLCDLQGPDAIDVPLLAQLYKDGSGECPAIRDFKDKPCSKARFGCWTCTVVRRDRSAEHMIASGYEELLPYFNMREWIANFRNDPQNRCCRRRNGSQGLGPFTIAARHKILERLLSLEKTVEQSIISEEQRHEINRLIIADLEDPNYTATDHSIMNEKNFPLFGIGSSRQTT